MYAGAWGLQLLPNYLRFSYAHPANTQPFSSVCFTLDSIFFEFAATFKSLADRSTIYLGLCSDFSTPSSSSRLYRQHRCASQTTTNHVLFCYRSLIHTGLTTSTYPQLSSNLKHWRKREKYAAISLSKDTVSMCTWSYLSLRIFVESFRRACL